MAYPIPAEERLDPDDLVRLQRRKLAAMWDEVPASNRFYRNKFSGIAFDPANDPVERLPFTTREEIESDQQQHPPYGTNLTFPLERYVRLHQTSGSTGEPLRWLDTAESWDWWKRCWGVICRAAGAGAGDCVLFAFNFGPFIGFWSAFEGASALGLRCLTSGGMTTTARLRFMMENGATIVCCTPTYALRMAEAASAEGIDLAGSAVRALIVAGEPGGSIPATRDRIESQWGARVFDHAGMTEIGPWGVECAESPGGLHVMEHEFIAEVIDPETSLPVADGSPGELVLTNLGRVGSPLIRYRTGDQVCLIRGRCACGRWFARAEGGILGRYDDMLLIRGNNVFPAAIEDVVRQFPEVVEFVLEMERGASMPDLCIRVETRDQTLSGNLPERIRSAVRDRLHFTPLVEICGPGSLPRSEMKVRRVIQATGNRQ